MPFNFVNGIGSFSQLNSVQNAGSSKSSNVFGELLKTYMGLSAGSIGDFSDGASSSYMDGIMGMGGSSQLFGSGSTGGNNTMFMLLMLMLLAQQGQSRNTNLSSTAGAYGNSNCQHNFVDAYANTAAQGIPSSSWIASNPPLTNHVGNRSAGTYRSVIEQFNVENNERYRVGKVNGSDTYCNIFAWDVTRAMGAEIPHYVYESTGEPAQAGGAGISEQTANDVNDWLNIYGAKYGWKKVAAEEAQYYANQGMPAVTSWKNRNGHGHLQVVSPSMNGEYNADKGVAIAQAGRQLIDYGYATDSYSKGRLKEVEYFVHI